MITSLGVYSGPFPMALFTWLWLQMPLPPCRDPMNILQIQLQADSREWKIKLPDESWMILLHQMVGSKTLELEGRNDTMKIAWNGQLEAQNFSSLSTCYWLDGVIWTFWGIGKLPVYSVNKTAFCSISRVSNKSKYLILIYKLYIKYMTYLLFLLISLSPPSSSSLLLHGYWPDGS